MRVAGGLSALLLGIGIVIVQPAATALTPSEVAEIAKQITVRIDGANTGSGVIIERQGDIYTVVTNWHVVQLEGNYTVQTPDGKRYTFNNSQVKPLPGVDLAVFQFTSNQNYRVAEKGNSDQVALGTNIAVAGYPQDTPDIRFLRGEISTLVTKPKDGYVFVYDIGGFPGMSGGAILDEQGKLVGIHGRATTRPDTNATNVLGIPLKTYLSLASSVQPVATPPAQKPPSPPVLTTPPIIISPSVKPAAQFSLVKTLIGHSQKVIMNYGISYPEGAVNSVAISADGKTLASGSDDKTIKIWNIATGQVIRTLNGGSNWVTSVAFSPNGKTLVSVSRHTIKIWNVTTGQEIRTLNNGNSASDSVYSIAFSPDGRTLASSGHTIKIWNLITGRIIHTLNGHSHLVLSVVMSPDSKTLVSGSFDKTIKLWNLVSGGQIRTLTGNSDSVRYVAISPDGKILVSVIDDYTIKIWNIGTGQVIRTLKSDSFQVKSVAISPDGKTLAGCGLNYTIKIWNLTTGQEISTLKGHSFFVNSVAFSPDGKTLASGSDDATIKIWRLSE
ncbi:MAG: trypsin-like peptidase domain-containing protein [Nostoc sp. ZfuVER08]|uniref:Trypsin-like peptidase domain-containing protein n=1 Tax=Nostoc punctiforme FACHB-252 TaxID=1357509 RepID=A0ABR8H7R7_NOSPU|nr:trypsin-like peptidase domain-containing protein [Nostoc punctiforme]MBD2611882.1 trypsin-like peptidase domain-containing protein [Nostoc punctiforme FACHB-252]MDZ8015873.1 trypsin-like peptidase domain-containing protein [Nostoc sp. ZfuVER08]